MWSNGVALASKTSVKASARLCRKLQRCPIPRFSLATKVMHIINPYTCNTLRRFVHVCMDFRSSTGRLMECEPSMTCGNNSCDSGSDTLSRLTTLAKDNGFTVHDVPGDGNCLFSAVAYQLESVSASEMREIVANHLESNSVFYRDFQAQPVQSGNAYNADTEAPSDQDANIDSIHDIEQQMQLRWERYIHRLRNGAWGDH